MELRGRASGPLERGGGRTVMGRNKGIRIRGKGSCPPKVAAHTIKCGAFVNFGSFGRKKGTN